MKQHKCQNRCERKTHVDTSSGDGAPILQREAFFFFFGFDEILELSGNWGKVKAENNDAS